jgi:hypothetical protein
MEVTMKQRSKWMGFAAGLIVAGAVVAGSAWAADEPAHSEFYGFVMTDAGYNNKAIDPNWFDVQRPTKLASSDAQLNDFGKDGSTFFSVRQTRFGVKSWLPTQIGQLKTQFEWELFGVGVDAGQTTIRLRHAYGEIGKFGAGQTWSPFMDIDVFPNTLEYWGPNGMAFFRNVQFRYMPIQGDTRMTIALERPGASGDQGVFGPVIAGTVTPRFPVPDLSAEYRKAISRGYVEVAGILRYIEWEDHEPGPVDLSGNVTGWGVNLSSNLKVGEGNLLKLQGVYGDGIENYMNDATADVGTKPNLSDPNKPIKGEALPVSGIVVFLDHTWNAKYTSSIGYSQVLIDNSEGQAPNAFHKGQYALANVLCTPAENIMVGGEVGWIHRLNNSDGYKIDDYHVQVSAKYNFSYSTAH